MEAIRNFMRVDPRASVSTSGVLAWINYAGGRTEEAARLWEEAWTANPDSDVVTMVWPLVQIYDSRGRHAEARALVEAILAINPELTAETITARGMLSVTNRRAHQESLRRAGMP